MQYDLCTVDKNTTKQIEKIRTLKHAVSSVVPVKAGTHAVRQNWISACAGMTGQRVHVTVVEMTHRRGNKMTHTALYLWWRG